MTNYDKLLVSYQPLIQQIRNNVQINLARGGIADCCCHLVNHKSSFFVSWKKLHVLASGSTPNLPFCWWVRDNIAAKPLQIATRLLLQKVAAYINLPTPYLTVPSLTPYDNHLATTHTLKTDMRQNLADRQKDNRAYQ